MARIVGEVRPRFVFVENSPALVTRGLGVVLSDLAALGYDCRWTVLGAADVGAPHKRDRLWIVAHSVRIGRIESADTRAGACNGGRVAEAHWQDGRTVADAIEPGCEDVAHADSQGLSDGSGGARMKNSLGTEPLITQVAIAEGRTDGALNPEFVEWLMGWPIGHTDLKPSATARFQSAPLQPSGCSQESQND